jgi:hypothetical protein
MLVFEANHPGMVRICWQVSSVAKPASQERAQLQGCACSLKNFTMIAGAAAGKACVPGWMNVTIGALALDS